MFSHDAINPVARLIKRFKHRESIFFFLRLAGCHENVLKLIFAFYLLSEDLRKRSWHLRDVAVLCPERICKLMSSFTQHAAWRLSQVIHIKMERIVCRHLFMFYFGCPKVIVVYVTFEKSQP